MDYQRLIRMSDNGNSSAGSGYFDSLILSLSKDMRAVFRDYLPKKSGKCPTFLFKIEEFFLDM